MKNINLFKGILILQTLALVTYTIIAFSNEGPNLFTIFLANVHALGWSGQFNLDFSCYLLLSGLWIMWRNKFTTNSIIFGIIATILGIIVFAPYLLWLSYKVDGDLKRMLIGDR
jgi:hypothetical protein